MSEGRRKETTGSNRGPPPASKVNCVNLSSVVHFVHFIFWFSSTLAPLAVAFGVEDRILVIGTVICKICHIT